MLSGCANYITGHSETISAEKLEAAKTYSFISDRAILNSIAAYPEIVVGPIETSLRKSIDEELQARGYVKSDPREADIFVSFAISAIERADMYRAYTARRGYYAAHLTYVEAHEYVEGALMIDIFDKQTGQQIWHGWAKEKVHSFAKADDRDVKIKQAVTSIIATMDKPTGESDSNELAQLEAPAD